MVASGAEDEVPTPTGREEVILPPFPLDVTPGGQFVPE